MPMIYAVGDAIVITAVVLVGTLAGTLSPLILAKITNKQVREIKEMDWEREDALNKRKEDAEQEAIQRKEDAEAETRRQQKELIGEVVGVKDQIIGVKSDVVVVKDEVHDVKSDVVDVKSDVIDVKSDVVEVKKQNKVIHKLVNHAYTASLEARLDALKGKIYYAKQADATSDELKDMQVEIDNLQVDIDERNEQQRQIDLQIEADKEVWDGVDRRSPIIEEPT